MGARALAALWICAMATGCVTVEPGLANAPGVPGASVETRVHDVIANGHDACERWMFPQGGVLRGQVPPCHGESTSIQLAQRIP